MVQKIFQGGFDTLNCLEGGRGGGVGGGEIISNYKHSTLFYDHP